MNIDYTIMSSIYKSYIENKTRLQFINKSFNNFFSYNYYDYWISLNTFDNNWILIYKFDIIHNSLNLDDVINMFLYKTDRFSIVLHIDEEINIICDKLNNFHISY
jgi:hypothetical protein